MDLNTSFWGNAIQLVRQRKIPGLSVLLIPCPGSCPPPHHPQAHTSPYWKKMQCHYLAAPITRARAHQLLCARTKKRDPSAAHRGSQAAHTSTRERPFPVGLGDGASCVQWGPSVGLCRPGRASGVNAQAGSPLKQQQVSDGVMWGHLSLSWLAQDPSLHREGNRSNQEPHQGPFMQVAVGRAALLRRRAGAQGGDVVSRLGLRRARLSQGEQLHSSQETGSS